MLKRFDTKQTFIVKIYNCQNDTWQGKIIWAEENKSQHFRSMLEMLKLMDEANRAVSEDQISKTSNA